MSGRQDNKKKKKKEVCKASSYSKGKVTSTEKETETERSGYWQPVDRETERVITRGQLETPEQG